MGDKMKNKTKKTKSIFAVYCGGEFERNVGIEKANEIFQKFADRKMTKIEKLNLLMGHGLYVSATVFLK